MIKQANRWVALGMLGVMSVGLFSGPLMLEAQAKDKKWRNYAIAGAAVTGYGLLKHKKGVAIVGGLGTAYAYSKYRKGKRSHRRYGSSNRSSRRYSNRSSRRYYNGSQRRY